MNSQKMKKNRQLRNTVKIRTNVMEDFTTTFTTFFNDELWESTGWLGQKLVLNVDYHGLSDL
jgi:hypothetical protein